MVQQWDADDKNNDQNLHKYLASLTQVERALVKGLFKETTDLLKLDEKEFLEVLRSSLTLSEMGKLTKGQMDERQKLMYKIMAVWKLHKEIIELHKKNLKQYEEAREERINKCWKPKHDELRWLEEAERKEREGQVLSVSQAARLHKEKNVTVKGIITGVQPLRKMIKGMSCECTKCNKKLETVYAKPEFYESNVPTEAIKKCPICKTDDYLGPFENDLINAVVLELQDQDTYSEIDTLRIIIFGDANPEYDDTRGIEKHIGEPIIVTGDIYHLSAGKSSTGNQIMVNYLYVFSRVKYLSKQDIELSAEDISSIEKFTEEVGHDNVINKLVEMFAPQIIGHNMVKQGLLLSATSANLDKTSKKIHMLLVGDVGLGKSVLLRQAVKLVPNSRFESCQFASIKSLMAIVTKEEGDIHILRIGPVPKAKGAVAALNEIGQFSKEDQGLLLDTMEEQQFTTNKYGRNYPVDSQTVVIASANPIGGSWRADPIDLDEIPVSRPLRDRFDLIFVFKHTRDRMELEKYADQKSQLESSEMVDHSIEIAKHIMHAKQRYSNPKICEEAITMLNQYYVNTAERYGSPRVRETVYRIAKTIATLKLKREVDIQDAKDTMQFYNVIQQQLSQTVRVSASPRDVAFNECLDVLKELYVPISYEELLKAACANNQQVSRYIGHNIELSANKKLRPICEMLQNHSKVKQVQSRPIVFEYMHSDSDPNDLSDLTTHTLPKKIGG